MAIQSQTNRVDYAGGNGVKIFPFTFPVYNLTDLQVYTVDINFNVVQRVRNGAGAFDYTQTDVNVPGGVVGGSITFNTAPDSFPHIILIRVVSLTQDSSFTNFLGVDGKLALEKRFDLLEMQIQQLQEQVTRVVRFPLTSANPPALLPDISNPNNFGGFLQFAADGSSVIVGSGNGGTVNITYGATSFSHRIARTGAGDSTFVVPADVNRIKVQIYGTGGGGGGGGAKTTGIVGGRGEAGAPGGYIQATLNVTPGQTLYLRVGIGGNGGLKGTASLNNPDGDPGTAGGATILCDHADFTTGRLLTAVGGGFGQGGIHGDATYISPGIWHEAEPIPGGSIAQIWVPDFTVAGGGASGGNGGQGQTGAVGTPSNGGGGGFGIIVIWY